ncbi:MAG: galactokinase [Bacteroidetes bacterium]|nr:MAG: galactokinase [Bacteroidota bacterium]PTM13606.1 MAG: galactokinase [Bacteroidota bacterium]
MYTLVEVTHQFTQRTGHPPTLKVRAPGRINIIGEHTDYNQGLVLPGAIDKSLFFAVRPNGTAQLRCWALDIDAYAEADLTAIVAGDQLWFNYLLGIADQFQQRGYALPGLDIVFGGDLPVGAGVSSSAALECGMAMVWNTLLKVGLDGPEMAQLAQRSSHEFIGIPCGIMDQFASLNGQQDAAILLDCQALSCRTVPVAVAGCEWVLLNSRVSHNLADSAYPERVRECQEGLAILQKHLPAVTALRDVTPAQLTALEAKMPALVYRRCRYVVGEHYRTLMMIDALQAGDAEKIGMLLYHTHIGLSEDYEVSCPEIECLFGVALQHPGVYGARLMGGGFGGCTLNLVQSAAREAFVSEALAAYEAAFGIQGDYLPVRLVNGVEVV